LCKLLIRLVTYAIQRRCNVEKILLAVGVSMQYTEIIKRWRCKYKTIKKILVPIPSHSIHTFKPVITLHLDALKIVRAPPTKTWAHFYAYHCVIFHGRSDTGHVSLQALQSPPPSTVPFHQSSILIFYSSPIHSV
jgi:hypothetical protein